MINLQRAEEEQEHWEEVMSQEPNAQEKAALAVAEADYEASVQKEIANQQYQATERQRADQIAKEMIEEENQQSGDITDAEHLISPDVQSTEEWHPEPKAQPKLRRRYVKRGSVYRRAKDASVKLRIGERVFIREQGHYQEIGEVSPGGTLPLIYKQEE